MTRSELITQVNHNSTKIFTKALLQLSNKEKFHRAAICVEYQKKISELNSGLNSLMVNPDDILNQEQLEKITQHFQNNHSQKLSRKSENITPYSIIKTSNNCLYLLYRGKPTSDLKQGFLGKGANAQVKIARSLQQPYEIVAVRIQQYDLDPVSLNKIKNLEKIQNIVGQFVDSALQEIPDLSSSYGKKIKYYNFSKFIQGQNLEKYLSQKISVLQQIHSSAEKVYKPLIDLNTFKHEIKLIGSRILKMFKTLHALNIVHGDLYPSNIMITDHFECHLIDWEFAAQLDQNTENATTSPNPWCKQNKFHPNSYLAPECYGSDGTYKLQSDQYSLGMVFKRIAQILEKFNKIFTDLELQELYDTLLELSENLSMYGTNQRISIDTAINQFHKRIRIEDPKILQLHKKTKIN